MSKLHSLLLCSPFVLSLLPAQHQPPIGRRIEQDWPAPVGPALGPAVDLACGRFVPGDPGRAAVTVRGGGLYLSYQPAFFEHFQAAGMSDVAAIATIPAAANGVDRLACVTAQGLRMAGLAAGVFTTIGNPIGTWADVTDVDVVTFGGTTFALGSAPQAVRFALLDPSGPIALMSFGMPPPAQVLDAVAVDWVPGGLPEIAVLTTVGVFVVDAAGVGVEAFPGAPLAGQLAVLSTAPAAVVRVDRTATTWDVATLSPGGVTALGGSLELPKPLVGLAIAHCNGDTWRDLVVSTQGSSRIVVLSDASGPQVAATNVVRIADVSPSNARWQPNVDNHANLVVDDIDCDGQDDFLIAQQASDQIVVLPEIALQLTNEIASAAFDLPMDDPVGLTFVTPMGWDDLVLAAETPFLLPPAGAVGTTSALLLRCTLPAGWSTSHKLLVKVYPFEPADGNGDAEDPVLPAAAVRYVYDLPTATLPGVPDVVDFAVPFDGALMVDGWWPDQQRFVVEMTLALPTADEFTAVGAPVFMAFAHRWAEAPTFEAVAAVLGGPGEGAVFHVDLLDFPASLWSAGPQPPVPNGGPGAPVASNRYVGVIRILDEQPAKPQVPPSGTTSLGGARTQ